MAAQLGVSFRGTQYLLAAFFFRLLFFVRILSLGTSKVIGQQLLKRGAPRPQLSPATKDVSPALESETEQVAPTWRRLLSAVLRGIGRVISKSYTETFDRLRREFAPDEIFRIYEARLQRRCRVRSEEIAGLISMLADLGDSDRAAGLIPALFEVKPRAGHVYQYAAVNCFLSGEYRVAEQIWSRLDEQRLRVLRDAELDAGAAPLLGRSWLLAIGHIAHLDIYLKDRMLRGLGSHRPKMMVPHGTGIPNTALLGMWERYIDVAYDTNPLREFDSSSELLTEEFWTARVNGRTEMYCRAGALIDRAWTAQPRESLLALSMEQKEHGWRVLERLGIPRDSWFACLHVREPGFHIAWHTKKPGIRDARIEAYELAAEQVITRGGYVVRVGDSSMTPLPPRSKTIDYAHSKEKSELMDILLCAMCRLFIGTNSGLSLVPPVFGVTCALTNWAPIAIPQWYSTDMYIPKLIFSRERQRFLTFDEMFRGHAGWKQFSRFFDEAGLEVVDNAPEDIAEFVGEVLDTQDGRESWSSADHARRTRLETLAVESGSYVGARMGRRFMDKYSHLI